MSGKPLSLGAALKFIFLLLILAALSAVQSPNAGAQAKSPATEASQANTATVTAPTVQARVLTGDLDVMLKRHYMRALVAYSKTQYYVLKGVQHGTSYEALIAFQDYINKKYPSKQKNLRFHVVFMPVGRDQLITRLAEGKGDISVAAMTVTPERQKLADFSEPFVRGVKEVIVTGPDSPTINAIEDLSGQEVFARRSSSYWEHLQQLNEKLKSEGKAPVKLRAAPEDLEDEDLLEMVNAGLVHVVVVDDYMPRLWVKIYTQIQVHPDVVLADNESFAWAMRKDSPQLLAAVNEFAQTHRQGTTFGNTLIQRYLTNTQMLRNAVSPAAIQNFNQTVEFFRKYSDQYKIDYLLMMAQGFQESGLNQQAKSHVGAIGIMQLMPATGAQMKVGDVHQAEANVHAGVKYIRYMVDQYYANEPMDDLNKILFAFASYNAGPGRIRQLRQVAETRGLNPNVWIDNVDMIAAEKIGPETVTYVANIYKYYVAYKLVAEQQAEHDKAVQDMQKPGV
jgi:membrane-bound lytic murein transglycosylase MltF